MKKATFGLSENIAAVLSCITWVGGLVFYICEKENKRVRFFALQSVVLFGGLWLLIAVSSFFSWLPVIGFLFSLVSGALHIIDIVAIIILALNAYNGGELKVPIIGDIVYKNVYGEV